MVLNVIHYVYVIRVFMTAVCGCFLGSLSLFLCFLSLVGLITRLFIALNSFH